MKKIVLLLLVVVAVILGVLAFVAKSRPTTSALQTELDSTIDDGGQADFDSLTQDASGL